MSKLQIIEQAERLKLHEIKVGKKQEEAFLSIHLDKHEYYSFV